MIFLSSQPDEYYFLWQLQLQLFNFRSLSIDDANIHILLGYEPEKGLSVIFDQFISDNPAVNIHAYPDTRESKLYKPSLRWHIISKHFEKFPHLQSTTIFHHDSDIVFRTLPNFKLLTSDDTWYVSDCRHYLESSYIKGKIGISGLKKMCEIVGVTSEMVTSEDHNAGGAQYLLKEVDLKFLRKMEDDSEAMYKSLIEENEKLIGYCCEDGENMTIQAWCADMWVIWWAALSINRKFVIHKELDFAWAGSPVEMLNDCKILHYTGAGHDLTSVIFKKSDYSNYSPFDHDLSQIDVRSASYFLFEMMEEYKKSNRSKRVCIDDVTILLPVNITSNDQLEVVYATTHYLIKHFTACIILKEYGDHMKIDKLRLPEEVAYEPVNPRKNFKVTELIGTVKTSYFAIWSINAILPVRQVEEAIIHIRNNQYSFIKPYSSEGLQVDILLKQMFFKILSADLFEENRNKMRLQTSDNNIGVVFGNLKKLNEASVENHDPENVIRELLNINVPTLNGSIYYLHPLVESLLPS